LQSCGIYSKGIILSLQGVLRTLRKIRTSDCFAILRNLLERHYPFPAWRPADAKEDQNNRFAEACKDETADIRKKVCRLKHGANRPIRYSDVHRAPTCFTGNNTCWYISQTDLQLYPDSYSRDEYIWSYYWKRADMDDCHCPQSVIHSKICTTEVCTFETYDCSGCSVRVMGVVCLASRFSN